MSGGLRWAIPWFQTRIGFCNWYKSTSAEKPMMEEMEDGGWWWFLWPLKLGQGCDGCCLYIFYWIVIIRKIRNWRESWSRTGEWLRISGGEWVAELTSWMTIRFNQPRMFWLMIFSSTIDLSLSSDGFSFHWKCLIFADGVLVHWRCVKQQSLSMGSCARDMLLQRLKTAIWWG